MLARLACCALAAGVISAWFAPPAQAAKAGSLDSSFGNDGRKVTDLFRGNDRANTVAVQSDGKIVVAGRAQPRMAITRYRRNGRLDRSFAGHGKTTLNRWSSSEVDALAIQANGRIIVAGNAISDLGLARFRRDGRLDRSFGNKGTARTGVRPGVNQAEDMAIQPDGKIVVVGYTHNVSSGDDYLIMARYSHDGKLDPSFGTGGTLITRFGTPANTLGYGVAIQDDGKLVVSGEVGNNWIVARFLNDGSLDPTFGTGGVSYGAPELIGQARDVAIQPDGKIVAAGRDFGAHVERFAVARYLPDGSFDQSFGTGGAQYTTFGSQRPADANSLALQDDGKIVVAGTVSSGGVPQDLHFALARYRPNGRLDGTFGDEGTVTTGFRNRERRRPNAYVDDWGQAVAIQRNGRILVVGYSQASRKSDDFALARYLG
jgi:uncharacterized delta-60 repeat protein